MFSGRLSKVNVKDGFVSFHSPGPNALERQCSKALVRANVYNGAWKLAGQEKNLVRSTSESKSVKSIPACLI